MRSRLEEMSILELTHKLEQLNKGLRVLGLAYESVDPRAYTVHGDSIKDSLGEQIYDAYAEIGYTTEMLERALSVELAAELEVAL